MPEGDDYLLGEWVKLPVPPEKLDDMADWDNDKLSAVLEMEESISIADIVDIIEHLDEFDLLAEVEDDEELSRYYAEELCTLDGIPEHLRNYFDYEAYGRDIHLEVNGTCTSFGYVEDRR